MKNKISMPEATKLIGELLLDYHAAIVSKRRTLCDVNLSSAIRKALKGITGEIPSAEDVELVFEFLAEVEKISIDI
jgi:hypothetical protein